MKNEIKSITEAFSMQPISLTINNENARSAFEPVSDIKKIVLEVMDENTNIYVGYNSLGKKIFQYLAKSVNVHYV